MAEKRMFAKSIVLSDAFLEMPLSARCLYFTLNMVADDDGFVGGPKSIIRQCGASDDDLKILIAKRYVLVFESGVIVIKHWRINNYLRTDRHTETTYLEEKSTLQIDERGAYTEADKALVDIWYTSGPPSIDKNSIDKISIDKNIEAKNARFCKPTLEEVSAYIRENGYKVNSQSFFEYYESNGWKVGKNSMKDWKAAVRSWNSREKAETKETSYDTEAIKRKAQEPIVYKKKN